MKKIHYNYLIISPIAKVDIQKKKKNSDCFHVKKIIDGGTAKL